MQGRLSGVAARVAVWLLQWRLTGEDGPIEIPDNGRRVYQTTADVK